MSRPDNEVLSELRGFGYAVPDKKIEDTIVQILAQKLLLDEQIVDILFGEGGVGHRYMYDIRTGGEKYFCLIAYSHQRVFSVSYGYKDRRFGGREYGIDLAVESVYWSDVAEVKYDKKTYDWGSMLSIFIRGYPSTGYAEARFERTAMMEEERFFGFTERVQQRVASLKAGAGKGHSAGLLEELERLGALREKGLLSEEDFSQFKQKLLDESV